MKMSVTWADDEISTSIVEGSPKPSSHHAVLSPPIEEALVNIGGIIKAAPNTTATAIANTAARTRIRILPGLWYKKDAPPEPTEAPPPVQHHATFLLTGPAKSGKTALCKSWVRRIEPDTGDSNSITRKLLEDSDAPTVVAQEDWFQKDLSYNSGSYGNDNSSSNSNTKAVRIKLLDTIQGGVLMSNDTAEQQLLAIQDHNITVDRTLLCVALPPLADDEAAQALFLEQVCSWKALIDKTTTTKTTSCENNEDTDDTSNNDSNNNEVVLLLTQADRLTSYQPSETAIADLCSELKIGSWYTVTSCHDSTSTGESCGVDWVFQSIVDQVVAQKEHAAAQKTRQQHRGKLEKDGPDETITSVPTTKKKDVDDGDSSVKGSRTSSRSKRKRAPTPGRNKKAKVVPTHVTPLHRQSLHV